MKENTDRRSKVKKVLVAGLYDWNYSTYKKSLSKSDYSIQFINSFQFFNRCFLFAVHDYIISLIIKIFYRTIKKNRTFHENLSIYYEFRAFDKFISKYIKNRDFDTVITWTGMSKETLKVAKQCGIGTILVQGSASLGEFEHQLKRSRTINHDIPNFWKNDQSMEYLWTDLILVESNYVMQSITPTVLQQKATILPPHVDTPDLLNKKKEEGQISFCTVQPKRNKGVSLISSWWRKLKVKPVLNLIGKTDDRELQNYNTQLEFRYLGQLGKLEYHSALVQSDVAIFPTYSDGGPRSLFESMAMGLCVLCSENCAGRDHIVNGVNGFVIPLSDERAWVEQIEWCTDNPKKTREIGLKARNYVKNNLCTENLLAKLETAIDQVSNNRK